MYQITHQRPPCMRSGKPYPAHTETFATEQLRDQRIADLRRIDPEMVIQRCKVAYRGSENSCRVAGKGQP